MVYRIVSCDKIIGEASTLADGIRKLVAIAATSHRFYRPQLRDESDRLYAAAECINYNADTMEARVSVRDVIMCSWESYEVKINVECVNVELTDVENQKRALIQWAAS